MMVQNKLHMDEKRYTINAFLLLRNYYGYGYLFKLMTEQIAICEAMSLDAPY